MKYVIFTNCLNFQIIYKVTERIYTFMREFIIYRIT